MNTYMCEKGSCINPGWFKKHSFSVQLLFGAVTFLQQSQYNVCCNNAKLKHIVLLTQNRTFCHVINN